MSAAYQYIGNSGTGIFTQSGGTNTTSGYLYLGNNTSGSGTYALSGTARLLTAQLLVGYNGAGLLHRRAKPPFPPAASISPTWSGSTGTYALNGGHAVRCFREPWAYFGHGDVHPVGRHQRHFRLAYLGYYSGGNGTYALSGSGSAVGRQRDLSYNSGATALFQQTGGMNTTNAMSIGPAAATF